MPRVIYLDNNATTQPSEAVIEAMVRALRDNWHNPSSIHRPGQAARHAVELARRDVAALIGARPREIVFTSSGTEAIDLAIRGALAATERRTLITTRVEHHAVRELAEDLERRGLIELRWAPLRAGGVVDPAALAGLIDDSIALVSVQWANNETGARQVRQRPRSTIQLTIGRLSYQATAAPRVQVRDEHVGADRGGFGKTREDRGTALTHQAAIGGGGR